ncbi:MAG: hypothetical protein K2G90_06230 [Muribaculaceae bacterium]|nr:hypothetical protein [Muribaculaceae bacterium]
MKLAYLLSIILIITFSATAQDRKKGLDTIVRNLKLKEVMVTAKKIKQHGDTISYSAASYRSADDKTLRDLLRKMPGIEVKEDGQVMYNGQWIKEFYIEGMNMLGDNYGVATNNIDAKSIGSVEVMENHQDVKMLRGVEKGKAPAMNIRLKENAKGAWTSTASMALGYQPKFSRDMEANMMTFRKRSQNISVFKTDNVGVDLRQDIKATPTFNSSLGGILLTPGKPTLDNRFSYLNDSYSLTVNQLFRIKENNFLTFNINYLYDKEKRFTDNITTYLISDSTSHVFKDSNRAAMHQHFAGVNAVYKMNGDDAYLKNTLSVNFSIPSGDGEVGDNITQNLSGHSISLNDVFEFKHRKIGGGFGDSKLSLMYVGRRGELDVKETSLFQRLEQHRFRFRGTTSVVAFVIPYMMFNLNCGVSVERQGVSVFRKDGILKDSSIDVWTAIADLTPDILLYRGRKIQCNIRLPIGVLYYSSSEAHHDYHKPYLSIRPSVYLSYSITDRWSFMLNASEKETVPAALSMMAEEYYSNYRTTFSNRNYVEMRPDRTFSFLFNVAYKSVLDMLFADFSLSSNMIRYGISSGYEIKDGEIHYTRIAKSTDQRKIQFDQNFSKGFFRGNSKVSEKIVAGTVWGDYFIGDTSHRGRNLYFKGGISYRNSFARWLTFNTDNEINLTKTYTDGKSDGKILNAFSSVCSLSISPLKRLSLIPAVMFYHNNYSNDYRNNLFLNCDVEYRIGEAVLSVKGINLLNSTVFRRFSDNGIVSRSNEYHLRGRTLMFGIRIRLF